MRHKNYYWLPLLAMMFLMVFSCGDDEVSPADTSSSITIEDSESLQPVLSQQGGIAFVVFTATGDWTASLMNTRAEEWIAISPASGTKGKAEISITAVENDTYDERNATIVLKSGSVSKNIVVTQKQKDALTITSSRYEVGSKGGNISIEVKANISFEVDIKSDWIKQAEKTRALTTSNLSFTVESNETGDKREGEIVIKSGELSEAIKVYQGFEPFITLTKKDFTIPEEGGNVDVEIRSTLDYEVKMLSDVDWITEVQSRAVSTHTRHYVISPNDTYDPREVEIVFYNPKDENVTDTVSIYQMHKGAILIARNEYQFDVKGGNLDMTVQTNLEFDVELSDSWIQQVQPTRALTEYDLSFTISENTEQKDRRATITVKDKNGDRKQVVIVKQSYKDLEREALIAFYKATNGANWTKNTNWCSDKPLSEWYGVSVDAIGNVISINLPSNNLSGGLPEELGDLFNLGNFDVSSNKLSGVIPESIGRLSNLTRFNVWKNNIGGNIPKSIGHLKKLEFFDAGFNNIEGGIPEEFADLPLLWHLQLNSNRLNGPIPTKLLQCKKWDAWHSATFIYPQQEGYVLFPENYYVSTDFSKDGEILTLQTHTKGNGIKLVVMGDLFVGVEMGEGGRYETIMKETMENYFSIEPYKSLRDYFDVIVIKAVSKHDWMSGETVFETKIGGNGLSENIVKCMEYVHKAVGGENLDNVQAIMVLNLAGSIAGGHCNMFSNGFSLSCCAYDKNDLREFKELIYHEAGGHGFGLLCDEYILYEETFTDVEGLLQDHRDGWNANVDYISDPQNVSWAHLINDSRYKEEGLGIFEGALYRYGVYRSTEYSVMRESISANDENLYTWVNQYNAPSREAIYKRAMKLAYGDSWDYDYEEFVKFDAPGHMDWIEAINKIKTRVGYCVSDRKYRHIPPTIYNYPAVVR